MKICVLSPSFPRFKGDMYHLPAYELAKRIAKNHLVYVITPHDCGVKTKEVVDSVRIFRFRYMFPESLEKLAYREGMAENIRDPIAKLSMPFFLISFFFTGLRIARRCDLIHAHTTVAALVGVLVKKIIKKPLIMTLRGLVVKNKFSLFLNKFILNNCEYVICVSSYLKNKAEAITQVPKYIVSPSSVDINQFNLSVKTIDLHGIYNIPKQDRIILFVGRLVEKKGLIYLLRALQLILKKHKVTIIIGGWGSEEEKLKKLIHRLGFLDKVKFIGVILRQDLPPLYRSSDLFILPSIIDSKGETETLGVVLIEAMACGLPIIGSKEGGIVDIITDFENGLYIQPKDEYDIAEKVDLLLSDSKLREKFKINGPNTVKKKFSWDKSAENVEEIYINAIKK